MADLNFVYTVVNHELRKYYVTARESDLGIDDPLNQIGWIYNFSGDINLVVRVSSFLIDTRFVDLEYQMHYETIRFALREIRKDPSSQELTFTTIAYESNDEIQVTGNDLRHTILRFFYDARSKMPRDGISIFHLCHNFPNPEQELNDWLKDLEEVGYLVQLKTLVPSVTPDRMVSTKPFKINPRMLKEVESELKERESNERTAFDVVVRPSPAEAKATVPPVTVSVAPPVKVLLIYSHADEELCEKLITHLSLLRRRGIIEIWRDREILPGGNWTGEISENMDRANLILLLVSPDFNASDYCYNIEMPRAIERSNAGKATVIPIILRDLSWRDAPYSELQALPKDGLPVTLWPNSDSAWRDVTEGIERILGELGALKM